MHASSMITLHQQQLCGMADWDRALPPTGTAWRSPGSSSGPTGMQGASLSRCWSSRMSPPRCVRLCTRCCSADRNGTAMAVTHVAAANTPLLYSCAGHQVQLQAAAGQQRLCRGVPRATPAQPWDVSHHQGACARTWACPAPVLGGHVSQQQQPCLNWLSTAHASLGMCQQGSITAAQAPEQYIMLLLWPPAAGCVPAQHAADIHR